MSYEYRIHTTQYNMMTFVYDAFCLTIPIVNSLGYHVNNPPPPPPFHQPLKDLERDITTPLLVE